MKKSVSVRIGLYPYEIKFINKKEMQENVGHALGFTWFKKREIDIVDDLDKIATELTIRHEVVHALLMAQGRGYQKKFELEELCEFVAWKMPEIQDVVDIIMLERYGNK